MVATGDGNWQVRDAAVERLTDQVVLAKVATEDKDFLVRLDANKRLALIRNAAR
jgi:hypothetical protein